MDIALVKIFFLAAALEFLFHNWKAHISQFLQRNVGIHQKEKYLWPLLQPVTMVKQKNGLQPVIKWL